MTRHRRRYANRRRRLRWTIALLAALSAIATVGFVAIVLRWVN